MSNAVGQRVGQGKGAENWPVRQGPAKWEARSDAPLVFHPGRMVEVSATGAEAALSVAVLGVREAQSAEEPTAWIGTREAGAFALDIEASGVDLSALVWIEAATPGDVARAVTHLTRSGAFGCVVVDLSAVSRESVSLPVPLLARLEGMCRAHNCCVLCVTARSSEREALGPLVSLRLHAMRVEVDGESLIDVQTLRDKRGGSLRTVRLRLAAPEGADGVRLCRTN